jgi:hypothetical protein
MGIKPHFLKRSPAAQIRDNKHRDLIDHPIHFEIQDHLGDGTPAAAGLEFWQDRHADGIKTGDESFREAADLFTALKPAPRGIHGRRILRKLAFFPE